jgi:ABC-type dipeptide/oligopeptide/nickel transport system permease subunit
MVATPYALLGLSGLAFFGLVVKAKIAQAGGIVTLLKDQLSKDSSDGAPPNSSA